MPDSGAGLLDAPPEKESRRWRALVADQRDSVVPIVADVIGRLGSLPAIELLVADATAQAGPESVPWLPQSVARGFAGLALFFGHLDVSFPDQGWDRLAHSCLSRAADATTSSQLTPALFSGLAGLAFVAQYLSRDGRRYLRLKESLLAALVPPAVANATGCVSRRGQLAVSDYDLISGVCGVGTELLANRPATPEVREGLAAVLSAIVAISEASNLEGWHTPPGQLQGRVMTERFPQGSINCGLAHGIPGPLALLALAVKSGVEVRGLRAAIAKLAEWLVEQRTEDEWGSGWPLAVAGRPGESPQSRSPASGVCKMAWCYGAPGVARSLWLAGEALSEPRYCEVAVDAMESVFRRPKKVRDIDTPTFCHGVAGLLQITLRFAHDMPSGPFASAARDLTHELLAMYTAGSPLGFTSVEPGGRRVDNPALLDGALGVVLVLLAAVSDVEPAWDRLFLLS